MIDFLDELLKGNVQKLENYIKDEAETLLKYEEGEEDGYSGFMTGLLLRNMARYDIKCIKKEKDECTLIRVIPKVRFIDNSPIIIMSAIKKKGESLFEAAQRALQEIKNKRIDQQLIDDGFIPENIKLYGFAFHIRDCLVLHETAKKQLKNEKTKSTSESPNESSKNSPNESSTDSSNESTADSPNEPLINSQNEPSKDIPNFEVADNYTFKEKEGVFIVDENGFDIWEATIDRINGNKYSIHFTENITLIGTNRILPKTMKNKAIYYDQMSERKTIEQIITSKSEKKSFKKNIYQDNFIFTFN